MGRRLFERIVTRRTVVQRFTLLLGGIASLQFVLTGFTFLFPTRIMAVAWLVAGVTAGVLTVRFERYKQATRRMGARMTVDPTDVILYWALRGIILLGVVGLVVYAVQLIA